MGKNQVVWYSSYLECKKDKLQSISRTVVAYAFFLKETFITSMCENDFMLSAFQEGYNPALSDIVKESWKTSKLKFCLRVGKHFKEFIFYCQSRLGLMNI